MNPFELDDRIRIVNHWEFADGIIGTVAPPEPFQLELAAPGEWQGHRRFHRGRKGPIISSFIWFDEPADDGSGDGPYTGAEIEAECLEPYPT
jgi:hypothetical protein